MSLRKSPTLTPALLASNRRNARKSTGPRTARGKAWSRLNSLREGWRSPDYIKFLVALIDAPPGRVGVTAKALLNSQAVNCKFFPEAAELAVQAEIDIWKESRRLGTPRSERKEFL